MPIVMKHILNQKGGYIHVVIIKNKVAVYKFKVKGPGLLKRFFWSSRLIEIEWGWVKSNANTKARSLYNKYRNK